MAVRGDSSLGTDKCKHVVVRLDNDYLEKLNFIADHYEVYRSDAVRRSINHLYKELTK